MHANESIWSGRRMRRAVGRCCVGLLAAVCMLNFGGCPDLGTIVLPASQDTPPRVPAAGMYSINVHNDSAYTAYVQVEAFIGNMLVHHAEATLAPAGGEDVNTFLACGWEEADRIVVNVTINSSRGQPMWSDEKTWRFGSDFQDGDTIDYTVVYPPGGSVPVAMIQAASTISVGGTSSLDGSASHDPTGKPLTYQWQQVSGSTVSLVDADRPVASFVVPTGTSVGTLVFRLTVSNGKKSASGEVSIAIVNRSPLAIASAPTQVRAGQSVNLDGSGSSDPDGDPLTYAWEQVSGTAVTLSAASQAATTFTAPLVSVQETLVFRLTVSDGKLSAAADCSLMVLVNSPPVVSLFANDPVFEGQTVVLNGSGSNDPDGDPLTYTWEQISGTAVMLSGQGANPNVMTFAAPSSGSSQTLVFRLTVSDGAVSVTADAMVRILVTVPPSNNTAPVLLVSASSHVLTGSTVTLDGMYSYDPDGDPLTFLWEQLSGTPAAIAEPSQRTTSFVAPVVPGSSDTLVFRLTVSDGDLSASVSVTVVVMPGPILLSTKAVPKEVYEGRPVAIDAYATNTQPYLPVTDFAQIGGLDVTSDWTQSVLTGPYYALVTNSFTAPMDVTFYDHILMFLAIANDGHGGTATQTVSVKVRLLGDINGDGAVNAADQALMDAKVNLGLIYSDPAFDPWLDLNDDTFINSADDALLKANMGRSLVAG